jgi:hypothetical protein
MFKCIANVIQYQQGMLFFTVITYFCWCYKVAVLRTVVDRLMLPRLLIIYIHRVEHSYFQLLHETKILRVRRGCDRMVVIFTTLAQSVPITSNVVSLNLIHGKVYPIQRYVIKFASDLRQVGGFLWVLQFPTHKTDCHDITEI